jgi:alkylated DNA nucleotide flippase Atl1
MVKAVETTLAELLEGTKQFQVPLFQRTYGWHRVQHERLWDDLVKLVETRAEGDGSATHFIGSLVLAPSPSIGPTGVQRFLVVDGQQRLTTLTLLLAAIRDHRCDTEDKVHADRVNDLYLINKYAKDQPSKLLPTQDDRASYLACLHRSPQAGGSDGVGAAYRFFQARLKEFDNPEDEFDVERLEDAVITGLSLVSVTAERGDNVHRIFESLNNTGLRLSQADLIRNYLFMRLPNRAEHVYRTLWLPLQKTLNREQLELLFWLDLVQSDETVKQTDIYSRQQTLLDRIPDEERIEAEVVRFADLGQQLAVILDPTLEPDVAVRKGLARLNQWGTTTVYPVLLQMLDRRKNGTTTNVELADAMRHLESFLVRRIVVGQASGNINRILLRAVSHIRDSVNVDDSLYSYLASGRRTLPTDIEVRAAVRAVPFYWNGRTNQRTLILQWLEVSYGSREAVSFDGLTIEHVLPQTLTDDWRTELRPCLADGEDVDSVHQSVLHLIGNLTLTGYNSEMSNRRYLDKRPKLAGSALQMNHEIATSDHWTRDEILDRCDRLAERIITIWPGPAGTTSDPAAPHARWVALAQVLAAMPSGRWTTYGDVATVIGTHPVPLGQRLANYPVLNAHRVLTSTGMIAPNFRWLDPTEVRSGRTILELEGIRFGDADRADPTQRVVAEELAELAGMEFESALTPLPPDGLDLADRFMSQLRARQSEPVVQAVTTLQAALEDFGGRLVYGEAAETSCFLLSPTTGAKLEAAWPCAVYPTGKIEVMFQHMAQRAPFDDINLRREFMDLLNSIDGVDMSEDKLSHRPGFDVSILTDHGVLESLISQLLWFSQQVAAAY